jgi:hypothetical protein
MATLQPPAWSSAPLWSTPCVGGGQEDNEEDPIEIVLLDVKTGKLGLNGVQKKFQAAATDNRVSFDVLRINEKAASETDSTENGTQSRQDTLKPS